MDLERLRAMAAAQHGVLSSGQLRELGVSASARRRMIDRGGWVPITKRVLRRSGAPVTAAQQALAAVLDAGPGAVLSHDSGAALWSLPGHRLIPPVVARAQSRSSTRLATVHAVRTLPARWVTTFNAIPVVRPELCMLQLCATTHPGRAERTLDTAWSMRLLSGRSLLDLLEDMGERGRNGVALLRELVGARGPDYEPPASNLEGRFRSILAQAGLPEMRRQVDSGGASWTGRVDFRCTQLPFIVEVQSERYHSALVDVIADAQRVRRLQLDGFVVLEVTDLEIWQTPAVVVNAIRQVWRRMEDNSQRSVR